MMARPAKEPGPATLDHHGWLGAIIATIVLGGGVLIIQIDRHCHLHATDGETAFAALTIFAANAGVLLSVAAAARYFWARHRFRDIEWEEAFCSGRNAVLMTVFVGVVLVSELASARVCTL
jgi:hypothetical protein